MKRMPRKVRIEFSGKEEMGPCASHVTFPVATDQIHRRATGGRRRGRSYNLHVAAQISLHAHSRGAIRRSIVSCSLLLQRSGSLRSDLTTAIHGRIRMYIIGLTPLLLPVALNLNASPTPPTYRLGGQLHNRSIWVPKSLWPSRQGNSRRKAATLFLVIWSSFAAKAQSPTSAK